MAAILKRRAERPPPATRSTTEKSPPIKIEFKEFSGEPEDWTTWFKVHRAQLSALGCADALTETAGNETKVNRDNFERVSQRGMGQARAALPGQRIQGVPKSYR